MRVIGTAGHVDHGKSTLVQTLSGIDPDRLQEEKQQTQMNIDDRHSKGLDLHELWKVCQRS